MPPSVVAARVAAYHGSPRGRVPLPRARLAPVLDESREARRWASHHGEMPKGRLGDLLRLVAAVAQVRPEDILSHRRAREITVPRHVLFYLARRFTTLSTPQIGEALRRDHTTVIHGMRAVEAVAKGLKEPPALDLPAAWAPMLIDALRIKLDRRRQLS